MDFFVFLALINIQLLTIKGFNLSKSYNWAVGFQLLVGTMHEIVSYFC